MTKTQNCGVPRWTARDDGTDVNDANDDVNDVNDDVNDDEVIYVHIFILVV